MAADIALEPEPLNPCCAEIKKRYQKLEEKRNALRQAVKLLENETNKLLNENQNLKKAYEEERARTGREKEAKEKESTIRNQLEKEMHDLKAEMSSCQKSGSSRSEADDESGLIRILEAEGEVGRLKELLDEEKKRSNSEKKNAEVEKKKAAEAWKFVEVEKSKVEEVKKHVEIARNKADEYRLCLEKLKMEANEAREKLIVGDLQSR
ncbi:stress response protein NST1-like [Phoenix dactylifera]|uniref:Stress response protein NST1-like n=1 Tax=Phoenix dactylifera TaxID=42345 RepID=A0A8B8ZGP3_PHODC|nr:stress response protein NST1-like [Phoenix dactylifera]